MNKQKPIFLKTNIQYDSKIIIHKIMDIYAPWGADIQ